MTRLAPTMPYIVILLICGFLYYQAELIAPAGEGRLGADFWPKAILIAAMVTCAWEAVRKARIGARREARATPLSLDAVEEGKPQGEQKVPEYVPWVGIALTVAYALAMPWLGYFLASILFVAAFVYAGNFRRPLVAACVAIAASTTFMFLFMRVVYVSLPIGVEPFAWISTSLMRLMGVK